MKPGSSRRIVRRLALLVLGPILLGAAIVFAPVHRPIELIRFNVPAGADSIVVAAGERYRASSLLRVFRGTHYRELWTQPIKVEVLNLREPAGGLWPTREGGGKETRSLHFVTGGGQRFVFRSVDKEITRIIDPRLARTLVAAIVQDQARAAHPASVVIAAPLQAAAGLPFTQPRLVVLPHDIRLGPFAARFAGLLGTLEESAKPGLGGALEETDAMIASLDSSSSNQVDSRAFLTARLLDIFLNDWDRHRGQWRWAPQRDGSEVRWHPIPVDRDQAFSYYDGLFMDLVRLKQPQFAVFGPEYPDLTQLTHNGSLLDRRFLTGVPRATWDSTAAFLVDRLTDSVIDAALERMPEPYRPLSAPMLAAALRQRRGKLPAVASRYYLLLARQPEVHAAAGDSVRLTHYPDGAVEVLVWGGDNTPARPAWFDRRFLPGETERIDLYLRGGPERLVVVGNSSGRIAVHLFLNPAPPSDPPRR